MDASNNAAIKNDKIAKFYEDVKNKQKFISKINDIYETELTGVFPDILNLNRYDFLNYLRNGIKIILTDKYSPELLELDKFNEIFREYDKDIEKKYNHYMDELSSAWREFEKIKRLRKEEDLSMFFLKNFRKHCLKTDTYAIHNCDEEHLGSNKFGNFITIYDYDSNESSYLYNKNRKDGDINYLICSNCKKTYFIDFFFNYCQNCSVQYCSSILNKYENSLLLPATWSNYHCEQIVNEKMRCIKCKSTFYLDMKTGSLTCNNCNCKFTCLPARIMWTCSTCSASFKSGAKVYNPLEYIYVKKVINQAILIKSKAHPFNVPCCKNLDVYSTDFYHKSNCDGILYFSEINKKIIVVCGKCKAINFFDKFIWTCPECKSRFREPKTLTEEQIKQILTDISVTTAIKNKNFGKINKNDNINRSNLDNNNQNDNKKSSKYSKKNTSENMYNKGNKDNEFNHSMYLSRINNENMNEDDKNNGFHINNYYRNKNNYNDKDRPPSDRQKPKSNDKLHNDDNLENNKYQYKDNHYRIKINGSLNLCIEGNSDLFKSPQVNRCRQSAFDKILPSDFQFKKYRLGFKDDLRKERLGKINEINEKNEDNLNSPKKDDNNSVTTKDTIANMKYSNNNQSKSGEKKNCYIRHPSFGKNSNEKEKRKDKIDLPFSKFYRGFGRNSDNKLKNEKEAETEAEDISIKKLLFKETKYGKVQENLNRNYDSEQNKTPKVIELHPKNKSNPSEKDPNENKEIFQHKYSPNKGPIMKCRYKSTNNLNNEQNGNAETNSKYDDNKKPKDIIECIKTEDMEDIPVDDEDIINDKLFYDRIQRRMKKILCKGKLPQFKVENYTVLKEIGEGSFGVIYKVQNNRSKINYAMKKLIAKDLEELESIQREYEIVHQNSHKFILDIYGISLKCLDRNSYILYVLMDLAEKDWDVEIISHFERRQHYTEKQLLQILSQINSALLFLQKERGISHRDIKPENILVFNNGTYKLADFGEAKETKIKRQLNTLRGTDAYMSPLLYRGLKCEKEGIKHNPYKSDMFSLGYCFIYAASLNFNIIHEIRDMLNMKKISSILTQNLQNYYSQEFIDLLVDMINVDEERRIDFNQLQDILKNTFDIEPNT